VRKSLVGRISPQSIGLDRPHLLLNGRPRSRSPGLRGPWNEPVDGVGNESRGHAVFDPKQIFSRSAIDANNLKGGPNCWRIGTSLSALHSIFCRRGSFGQRISVHIAVCSPHRPRAGSAPALVEEPNVLDLVKLHRNKICVRYHRLPASACLPPPAVIRT